VKVILQEDVDHVGHLGDMVEVADGFGRNYLIPRGLALIADERSVREFAHRKRLIEHRQAKAKGAAQDLAKRIENVTCTINKQVGENDRLYGSVTAMDIEEALIAEGLDISRRQLQLAEPIKNIGVFNVPVKLHADVFANLKVYVVGKVDA
jgi:large subunit ribosomal protein L9